MANGSRQSPAQGLTFSVCQAAAMEVVAFLLFRRSSDKQGDRLMSRNVRGRCTME